MGDSVKGLGDVKKDDSYKAPLIKGPVPSVQAVQKMGGTKARLQKKEVVGVEMRGKLEMDMFFQKFAWDGKNGDGPEVGWICTVTTFVEWPDGGTFPLGGNCEEVMEELMMDDSG